jgi:hypothetical protein
MITAAGYVLLVPEDRREILLAAAEDPDRAVGEPVYDFDHSRRAPLIVLAAFGDGAITHVASGKKGAPGSGGTGMIRLNLRELVPLGQAVPFGDVVERVPQRFKVHVRRTLENGGLLPKKSLGAVVDALLEIEPGLSSTLAKFSESRTAALARITPAQRANLAVQKETVSVALRIAGMDTDEVLQWTPAADSMPSSFLAGLPGAVLREDAMIIADFSQLPGFDAVKDTQFAAKEFVDPRDNRSRLAVLMANRLPLEQQTGADLIYYHERHKAFVMVQYKAMDGKDEEAAFRWKAGDQLAKEIAAMDALLVELRACPDDPSPDSFRLHLNPFFLKICARQLFNPDDKGLFPGMYFPLDLWKSLAADPATLGKKGGRFLSYVNARRRLTNTEFVTLIAGGWIGTTVPQSSILSRVIKLVLETGKTVTFAVKRNLPPADTVSPDDETEQKDELREE